MAANNFKGNPTNAKILFGSALGNTNLGAAATAIQEMRFRNMLLYDNDQIHIDQIAALGLSDKIDTIKVNSKPTRERVPFSDATFSTSSRISALWRTSAHTERQTPLSAPALNI